MDKTPKSCFLSLLLVVSYAGSVSAFSAVPSASSTVPLVFLAAGAMIADAKSISVRGGRKMKINPLVKFTAASSCIYAALKYSGNDSLKSIADQNGTRVLAAIIGTLAFSASKKYASSINRIPVVRGFVGCQNQECKGSCDDCDMQRKIITNAVVPSVVLVALAYFGELSYRVASDISTDLWRRTTGIPV